MLTKPFIIAGIAGGAVWLLDNQAAAKRTLGRVIPPHITAAQRAALAELAAPMFGVAPKTLDAQVSTRWLELNRAMLASRGPSIGRSHLAAFTKDDLIAISSRFLSAVEEGALVATSDPREAYQLWPAQRYQPSMFAAVWSKLADSDLRELTDLGRAAAHVMRAREGLRSGFLSSDHDLMSVTLAIGVLAAEMDGQGYLVSGTPETKSIAGGVGAALGAVAELGTDVLDGATDIAVDLLGDAAGAIVRSPAFWAGIFGLVAWRALK